MKRILFHNTNDMIANGGWYYSPLSLSLNILKKAVKLSWLPGASFTIASKTLSPGTVPAITVSLPNISIGYIVSICHDRFVISVTIFYFRCLNQPKEMRTCYKWSNIKASTWFRLLKYGCVSRRKVFGDVFSKVVLYYKTWRMLRALLKLIYTSNNETDYRYYNN